MNKFLARTLTVTLLLMMVCTTAFAAVNMTASKGADGKITVTVTGLTAGEESTLLAVDKGTALSTVADNTTAIRYIDQLTAANGTATYTFDVGTAKNIDIYSGYTSMPAGSDPLKEVIEEKDEGGQTPVDPPVSGIVYGDVDGNRTVNLIDAGQVIQYHFDPTTAFGDAVNGLKAGDVDANGAVNLIDAGLIIQYHFDPVGTVFPANSSTK